ncbi:MAG: hypothetical protein ACOH2L_12300 [Devosia sp.]
MKIDRRITNGLAWAGVVLVVGVPLADMVSAQVMGDGSDGRPVQIAMIEPVAAPARVAPIPMAASARPAAPVAKPVVQSAAVAARPVAPVAVAVAKPVVSAAARIDATTTGSVVDSYLQSGKPMPSYITGASQSQPAAPSAAPALSPIIAVPAVPAVPAAAAPTAPTVPVETASLTPDRIAPMPMPLSMRPAPVLIVPDVSRTQTQTFQVGPSGGRRSSATVTSRDLQDWESGPLSEFLARRQAAGGKVDPNYDPDGFYLDQGPNAAPNRDRLIGPADEVFFPFAN